MPSAAILEQKKQVVAELVEKLQSSVTGVVVDYKGISVADDTKLRKELREAGVDYAVVKNTLLRLATAQTVKYYDIRSAFVISFIIRIHTRYATRSKTDTQYGQSC